MRPRLYTPKQLGDACEMLVSAELPVLCLSAARIRRRGSPRLPVRLLPRAGTSVSFARTVLGTSQAFTGDRIEQNTVRQPDSIPTHPAQTYERRTRAWKIGLAVAGAVIPFFRDFRWRDKMAYKVTVLR
jgi:hypothetical protein